jgi:hypothetical protein
MHRVQDVCSNLIIQGLIKVEVLLERVFHKSSSKIHSISTFPSSKDFEQRGTRLVKKNSEVFHPSIHPQGCFSVGFFWRRLSLVSRDRRGVRSWRVCGRAGGLEGTTHCELASAGGIFAMHTMQIPFLIDVLCFFFPLQNLSQFLRVYFC